jgi:hypothetical protein
MLFDEDIKKIQNLRSKGFTVSKIAREMNLDRKTVRKYLEEDGDDVTGQPLRKAASRPSPKRVVFEDNPEDDHPISTSKTRLTPLKSLQEDLELSKTEFELQKLQHEKKRWEQKVNEGQEKEPLVSAEVRKKKDQVEIVKLDLEEQEVEGKARQLKEEETKRARAEEEARIELLRQRQRLEAEQRAVVQHQNWIKEIQKLALTYAESFNIPLPATFCFKIKDTVGEVLGNRSQDEEKWAIEELIKETVKCIIQPLVDMEEAKKKAFREEQEAKRRTEELRKREERKAELVRMALFEVGSYFSDNRLENVVNEETRKKVKKEIHDHLMETLTGDEFIPPWRQVRDILDKVFSPLIAELKTKSEKKTEEDRMAIKEMIREVRIERLLGIGMNQLNYYLSAHKELGTINFKEREETRQYLETELKKEIDGTETNQEVEKIAEQILDGFFFED